MDRAESRGEGRENGKGGRWIEMEGRGEREDDEKRVEVLGRIQTEGDGDDRPLDGLLWVFPLTNVFCQFSNLLTDCSTRPKQQ